MSKKAERAAIALKVIGAFFRPKFWRAVRENRAAVKAGQPKPHKVIKLIADGFEMGKDAHDAVRRK